MIRQDKLIHIFTMVVVVVIMAYLFHEIRQEFVLFKAACQDAGGEVAGRGDVMVCEYQNGTRANASELDV